MQSVQSDATCVTRLGTAPDIGRKDVPGSVLTRVNATLSKTGNNRGDRVVISCTSGSSSSGVIQKGRVKPEGSPGCPPRKAALDE